MIMCIRDSLEVTPHKTKNPRKATRIIRAVFPLFENGESIRETILQFQGVARLPERIRKEQTLFMRAVSQARLICDRRDRPPQNRIDAGDDKRPGNHARLVESRISLSRMPRGDSQSETKRTTLYDRAGRRRNAGGNLKKYALPRPQTL